MAQNQFLETITLLLKHSDISTNTNSVSESTNCGYWENGKQKSVWRVNLRTLLGNKMYDNNELFVIRLNQLSYDSVNFPSTNKDQQLLLKMSGLNFVNSTYDVKTGNNSQIYQMCIQNFIPSESHTITYSPNVSMACFKKGSDNVEICIELFRATTDLPAIYGGVDKFPHMVYSFDIYAVKE